MKPTIRLLTLLSAVAFVGCSDKKPGAAASAPSAVAAVASSQVAPTAAKPDAGVVAVFREEDFVETDVSRDPFRTFTKLFEEENKTSATTQREVLLDQYSVDDLKLVGIVTGGASPRAMLVDPTGRGWIVTRGQYIGKAELVRGTSIGGASYELNWRIDRIRPADVVLVREDPAHSDIPPATRVIPLRPNEAAEERLQ